MLRLKSIFIAALIAAPMVINAADFTPFVEAKHGILVTIEKTKTKITEPVDTTEETDTSFYSFRQGSGENIKSIGTGFKFSADQVSGKVKISLGLSSAKAADWYVQYALTDDMFLKMGKFGSPFGLKGAGTYFGQSGASGKYGTSGPELNLMLGIKGVSLSIGPNDNVTTVLPDPETAGVAFVNDPMVFLPKLAVAYDYSNDMARIGVSTVLNVIGREYAKGTDTSSVTMMGFAAATHVRLHFSKIWIQLNGAFGLNGHIAGVGVKSPSAKILGDEYPGTSLYIDSTGSLINYTQIGFPMSVIVDLTENLELHAGFGMYIEKEGIKDAPKRSGMDIVAGLKIKNPLPGLTVWPDFSFAQHKIESTEEGVKGSYTKQTIKVGVGSKWAF